MSTRIWIGGGNNSAGNPQDWYAVPPTPFGTPQHGDTLYVGSGATINVTGNQLRGDQLNFVSTDTMRQHQRQGHHQHGVRHHLRRRHRGQPSREK